MAGHGVLSMKAAYEDLSRPLRDFLAGLTRYDFAAASLPRPGGGPPALKHARALEEHPPVLHPVVRTHPETGADGLFRQLRLH